MPEDWRDEYYQLIDDCENRDTMINAWEADFLVSIRSRLDDMRELSPAQTETLDRIWEKATSKG